MTTIAYRDKVMAGDGLVSDDTGHIWTKNCVKVWRLSDGSLFGTAGDSEAGHRLHLAAEAAAANGNAQGLKFPHFADGIDVAALLVTPDGKIWLSEGSAWEQWPDDYAAIGNGRRCALTALRLGHTVKEAVQAGIEGDCFSGGLITVVQQD